MKELEIRTDKRYSVIITDTEKEGYSAFGEKVFPLIKGENVAVITDDRVNALYPDLAERLLSGKTVFRYVIKHGERSKNAANYFRIIKALAENRFTREDTVITFGGGVVGDLGAFIASTYMRGITLIAMPTTLLSAVDSSVGGKTAIDLPAGKNLCGTFYQPNAVFCDTATLKTLPEREIKNGLGEVVKYAILSETVNKTDIENCRRGDYAETIYKCLKIKKEIVEEDEKEGGKRALLNLGHTFGHAIESLSGYRIPHGACVAKGLAFSLALSAETFDLSAEEIAQALSVIKSAGIDLKCPYYKEQLCDRILSDKKRKGDRVDFIGFQGVGKPIIVGVPTEKTGEIFDGYERLLKTV